jgi:hypothetical protein
MVVAFFQGITATATTASSITGTFPSRFACAIGNAYISIVAISNNTQAEAQMLISMNKYNNLFKPFKWRLFNWYLWFPTTNSFMDGVIKIQRI